MLMRLIGDVHGKYKQYKRIIKDSPLSVQVGDMGVGFRKWPHGEPFINPPYDAMVEHDAYFIRGNHDNPAVCEQHTQWIRDGYVDDLNIMYVGGADSVDRAHRVEGYSWWPDEELSTAALSKFVDAYVEQKPRVMVTHDAPQEIAAEIARAALKITVLLSSRTRQAFQSMWSAHPPDLWIFGHWHNHFDCTLRGTRFICLAELEYMDLDL